MLLILYATIHPVHLKENFYIINQRIKHGLVVDVTVLRKTLVT